MTTLTGKGIRARERIVRETAHIIRQQGFKAATVRAISEAAQVNIAAIRYYFGSKDDLIGEAIDYLMNDFEHIVHHLENQDFSADMRLFLFMSDYFKLAKIHPALYRSISFVSADPKQNTYFIYTSLLYDRCWKPVIKNLAEYTRADEETLQIYATQLFAVMEYLLILQSNYDEAPGVKFVQKKHIDTYIQAFLDRLKP